MGLLVWGRSGFICSEIVIRNLLLSPQLVSPVLLSFMALHEVEEGPRRSWLTVSERDITIFMRVYRNLHPPSLLFAFYLFLN